MKFKVFMSSIILAFISSTSQNQQLLLAMSDSVALVALVSFGFFGLLAFFALLLIGGGAAFFWKRQKKTVRTEYFEASHSHTGPQCGLVPLTPLPQLQPVSSLDAELCEMATKICLDRIAELAKPKVDLDGYEIYTCSCGRKNLRKSPYENVYCSGCRNGGLGLVCESPKDKKTEKPYRPEEHAVVAPIPDTATSSPPVPSQSSNGKEKEEKKNQ